MLELAHGHAPFAKFPPIKVLLMTVQNPPPQLEAERGQRHFSKVNINELPVQCDLRAAHERFGSAVFAEGSFKTTHSFTIARVEILPGRHLTASMSVQFFAVEFARF